MAESNRATPPLCPCGFWGSTNTSGLCSKCYKEQSQKPVNDKSLLPTTTTPTTTTSSQPLTSPAPPVLASFSSPVITADTGGPSASSTTDAGGSATATALSKDAVPTIQVSEPLETGVPSDPDAAAGASGGIASAVAVTDDVTTESLRPVQKNKKRCYRCKARLELAFTEIGRCKCEYVFCELHRLPEQHDCEYDHKENGRKAALDKMVSPKKHIGTSLKRLDSDH